MLTRAKVLRSSLVFSLSRVRVMLGQRIYPLGLNPELVDQIAGK